MIEKPIISVIIPTLQGKDLLLQLLLKISEIDQEIPFKVIVVVDVSTDETVEELNSLKFKFIYQKNAGLSAT